MNPGERYDALITPSDAGRVGVPLPHPAPRRGASGMFGMVNTLTSCRGGRRRRDRQGPRQLTADRVVRSDANRSHANLRTHIALDSLWLRSLRSLVGAPPSAAGPCRRRAWVRDVAAADQPTAGYLSIANASARRTPSCRHRARERRLSRSTSRRWPPRPEWMHPVDRARRPGRSDGRPRARWLPPHDQRADHAPQGRRSAGA